MSRSDERKNYQFYSDEISLVVNGMVPFNAIDIYAPIASAFSTVGLKWASLIVAAGTSL